MDDEVDKRDTVFEVHKEVVGLAEKLTDAIEEFFKKDTPILTHNEKFLVANRAISIHGKMWFEHFCREFNPENKKAP